MQTFKERAEELAQKENKVKGNKVYETLAKEFNIGVRTASDRFKSIFGIPVRDYISLNNKPTDQQIIEYIIKSDTFEQFFKLTNLSEYSKLVPILNRLFGTSKWYDIKNKILLQREVFNKSFTREDNESILISQYLGDGHIERNCSFKIEHGHKQYEYLKFKIRCLNTAYPLTNGYGYIRPRTIYDKRNNKTYYSYSYRTGQVLNKQINKILGYTKKELVNKLTPFGILLFYLDDGYITKINRVHKTCSLGFSIIDEELRDIFIEYFKSYGYNFNNYKTCIEIQSKPIIIQFIQDFILPYKNIIPECMHYKFNFKDIVGEDLLN